MRQWDVVVNLIRHNVRLIPFCALYFFMWIEIEVGFVLEKNPTKRQIMKIIDKEEFSAVNWLACLVLLYNIHNIYDEKLMQLHVQEKIIHWMYNRLNSLAPGRFEQNFRYVIFKLISGTDDWGISREIAFWWMPLDLTDDKSTLVQVMAWCRQATSHYLS